MREWPMGTWSESVYGDPCRGCGYGWGASFEDARTSVVSAPDGYRRLLAGATGTERHPDLAWSVTAYVCHVGDNLRIWAERLAGVAGGGPGVVAAYDENALAAARRYGSAALAGALWSLGRAAADWVAAVDLVPATGTVLVHPERGELGRLDVARANAHDVAHHRWDVARSLGRPV